MSALCAPSDGKSTYAQFKPQGFLIGDIAVEVLAAAPFLIQQKQVLARLAKTLAADLMVVIDYIPWLCSSYAFVDTCYMFRLVSEQHCILIPIS